MVKKLVILAAVNGGAQRDRDGAKVPINPGLYACLRRTISKRHSRHEQRLRGAARPMLAIPVRQEPGGP